MTDAVILIPAYEPDRTLVDLVHQLPAGQVLVVDDGSGAAYAPVFAAARSAGATVITLDRNQGKGSALRVGFAWIADHRPGRAVVCADSDGQHRPYDIAAVADRLATTSADMVLGVRRFTGPVPARSRYGNELTKIVFRCATGRRLLDTQTGLRAYPGRMLGWLRQVSGDRFEYELRLLLRAVDDHLQVDEVDIETVYLPGNPSSHFRPVRDSTRIYLPLLRHALRTVLRFTGASLAGFAIDAALFTLAFLVSDQLVVSAIAARLVSATANYLLNRHWVFRGSADPLTRSRSAPRYTALAATVLAVNLVLLQTLSTALGSVALAKIITEVALFTASFAVQRWVVFPTGTRSTTDAQPPVHRSSTGHKALTSTAQGRAAH